MLKTITVLALGLSFTAQATNDHSPEAYFEVEREFQSAAPVYALDEVRGNWEGRLSAASGYNYQEGTFELRDRYFVVQNGIHTVNVLKVEEAFIDRTSRVLVSTDSGQESRRGIEMPPLTYSATIDRDGFKIQAQNFVSHYVTHHECRLVTQVKLLCRTQTQYATNPAASQGVKYVGYVRK